MKRAWLGLGCMCSLMMGVPEAYSQHGGHSRGGYARPAPRGGHGSPGGMRGGGGGPVRISRSAMKAMKSGLANAARAYAAEAGDYQGREEEVGGKIDDLKSRCKNTMDQIKDLRKQLATAAKNNDQKLMNSVRKQIEDLTIEYQTMWRGMYGEYQKKSRFSSQKKSALKKQQYAEHVLQRVNEGKPVSISTMNKIMKGTKVASASKGGHGAHRQPRLGK